MNQIGTVTIPTDIFIDLCIKLQEELDTGIIQLHKSSDAPAKAYLVTAEHMDRIRKLIPESDEATELFMDHEHVAKDEAA